MRGERARKASPELARGAGDEYLHAGTPLAIRASCRIFWREFQPIAELIEGGATQNYERTFSNRQICMRNRELKVKKTPLGPSRSERRISGLFSA